MAASDWNVELVLDEKLHDLLAEKLREALKAQRQAERKLGGPVRVESIVSGSNLNSIVIRWVREG